MSGWAGIETFADVSFLGGDREEKLDAYLPDLAPWPGLRPAVIVIHGGGWAQGDKAEPRQRKIAAALTERGYAVFSINYRLTHFSGEILKSPPVRSCWPDCLHDCLAAVRFVRANAASWRVDPARLAFFGLSAGAHLALLAAGTALRDRDVLSTVSAIISFYGPHDVREIGSRWHFGEPCEDAIAVREAASPVLHFGPGLPPVFVAHGLEDQTVPVRFARELAAGLERHGVACESHLLPGAGHGFDLDSPFADLRAPVAAFLARHLAFF